MKYREKEKLWLKSIKDSGKIMGWKFKGYFLHKITDDLFFSSYFYIGSDNIISGWLEYKPVEIDNTFWDIVDLQSNKTMPLSFRGEAAFCVRGLVYMRYKIPVSDENNPNSEIVGLLRSISDKVQEKVNQIKTPDDFMIEMHQDEELNSVGIITSLIGQNQMDKALAKIEQYKNAGFNSGFTFSEKSFYDLAKDYCEKSFPSSVDWSLDQPKWSNPPASSSL